MLVKRTSKNQITIPKDVMRKFPGVEHFEVEADEDRIVLIPLRRSRAAEVREQLARLGIGEADIRDAVDWARGK